MDPTKLNKFTQNKLVLSAADKYVHYLVEEEMPWGLKEYMDLELFPQIHLKVGHGISLATACCWLHSEGFKYTTHKKGLYFCGHDWPDVVEYWQNVFLLVMKMFEPWLVWYEVGNVGKEMIIPRENYVEHWLVLMPQDEMTLQANDIMLKMWVYNGQYMLRKKGLGWGLHQSDVINSVIGWLKNGSQTLEYSKNYDGYWNGELFVKQVSQLHWSEDTTNSKFWWSDQGKDNTCLWRGSWPWISGTNHCWQLSKTLHICQGCFSCHTYECQSWWKTTQNAWHLVYLGWLKNYSDHGISSFTPSIPQHAKGNKGCFHRAGILPKWSAWEM